jgi:hypothetical protein
MEANPEAHSSATSARLKHHLRGTTDFNQAASAGHAPRDTSQKFGNPEIGDKKSAHQARFPSSLIDRSPNSVFWRLSPNSDYPNSSEFIRIAKFGYSGHPNNQIFGYSVIRVFGSPE